MSRLLGLDSVVPTLRGWDSQVNNNFEKIAERMTNLPLPLPLVYKTTPFTGATQLSTLAAADFLGCYAHITDPTTIATNGSLVYSDGTSWKYVKSEAAV